MNGVLHPFLANVMLVSCKTLAFGTATDRIRRDTGGSILVDEATASSSTAALTHVRIGGLGYDEIY